MNALRAKWQAEVQALIAKAQKAISEEVVGKIDVDYSLDVDRVEPNFKLHSTLDHHMPETIGRRRVEDKARAVEVIKKIWGEYRRDFGRVLDFRLWLEDNTDESTRDLSHDEFAERMRLKREHGREAKTNT